jgi:hypothetical protein
VRSKSFNREGREEKLLTAKGAKGIRKGREEKTLTAEFAEITQRSRKKLTC